MTPFQRLIGFTATLTIGLILVAAIASEPWRQDSARQDHVDRSLTSAIEIYAHNCVQCHGPAGAGFDIYPALNDETVNKKDPVQLYRTIERGVAGTEMAAFGSNEGGMLTRLQIDSLVMLIQLAEWKAVYTRVTQLNLLPTATPSPANTSNHLPTATTTMPPTASPTAIQPSSTNTLLFEIEPTSSGPGVFNIVPTTTGTIEDVPPLFEILPTAQNENTAEHSSSPFDIVATATATPGGSLPIQPMPTESDD